MNSTKANRSAPASCEETSDYDLDQARQLRLQGSLLLHQSGADLWSLDLSQIHFRSARDPAAATSLYNEEPARRAALCFTQNVISSRRSFIPDRRSITRQIYLLRNVYDWLAPQGTDRLSRATQDQLSEMMASFAELGWPHSLGIVSRWTSAASLFNEDDTELAFHFHSEGGARCINAINQGYWRPRLGWGGGVPVPREVRMMLQDIVGARYSRKWASTDGNYLPPSKNVLRNTIAFINQWHSVQEDCDKPSFRISRNSNRMASRLARRSSAKTGVLTVTDAGSLMKSATFVIDEVLPLLIELLNEPFTANRRSRHRRVAQRALETSSAREAIETLLSRPIVRWLWSGSHGRNPEELCVDQLIAAVQGAAFIIICAMNGRRSGEVCHPTTGLRTDSLIVLDEDLLIAKMSFYIEKTRFCREDFYVNALTVRAYQALLSLRAHLGQGESVSETPESIFALARRSESSLPDSKRPHFSPTSDTKRTRTLNSFFEVAGERCTVANLAPHSLRRCFALLYYYRFEQSDLLSLQQHLRHTTISNTIHYVTGDTGYFFPDVERRLFHPIDKSAFPCRELQDVSYEILVESIHSILAGTGAAGGFVKFVRALYRQMVDALTEGDNAAALIADRLRSNEHVLRPMPFGQCHSTRRRSSIGNCRERGRLHHEHASPALCFSCPFHFTSPAYYKSVSLIKTSMEAARSQAAEGSVQAGYLNRQIEHLQWLLRHVSPQGESAQ